MLFGSILRGSDFVNNLSGNSLPAPLKIADEVRQAVSLSWSGMQCLNDYSGPMAQRQANSLSYHVSYAIRS